MDELIATFKSRHPRFAFDDDPPLPDAFPKSAVWGGPGWQNKRTATRLEAQYWRTKLRLLSHYPELNEAALRLTPHPFTPLADPSAVGMAVTERKKELWRFAVSEETVKAADFQPGQYIMCIDGRIVQALVLTHETAKEVEIDPYCVTALMALRPVGF